MKSTLSFVAALLGAGLTGATPLAQGGMFYDIELEEAALVPRRAEHVVRDLDVQDVQYVDKAQVCVIDIYRAGNPSGTPVTVNANFDFTSFCSAYLPNAGGAATTTVYFPSLATTTGVAATISAYTTKLTTISMPDPAKAEIHYCPISNVGATCNITAWAGPTGAFHAGTEDFESCHQLCLKESTCQSFQVSSVQGTGIIPQCNLYTVSAGGSFNGTKNFNLDPNAPFIVYDKACAWGLPAGCNQQVTTAPVPPPVVQTTLAPKTTAAPGRPTTTGRASSTITTVVYVTYIPPSSPFSVGPGGKRDVEAQVEERGLEQVEERGLEVRDSQVIPPPWILSLIGTVTLSQICTCVLGGVAGSGPQATIYLPSYNYATSTPTVTQTFTQVSTVTALLASGTIWSSVP